MILHSEIEGIFKDKIQLKRNKSFLNLPLEDIEYSSQSQPTDAGNIMTETVTAKVRYNQDLEFLKTALSSYVLRLQTNNTTFIVGSPQYPANLTYRHNNIYINLTFKATKPQ